MLESYTYEVFIQDKQAVEFKQVKQGLKQGTHREVFESIYEKLSIQE